MTTWILPKFFRDLTLFLKWWKYFYGIDLFWILSIPWPCHLYTCGEQIKDTPVFIVCWDKSGIRWIRNVARLFSQDWFLTQQVLSEFSKSLVEISFPFRVTCNSSKISVHCLTYFYRLLSLSTESKSDCLITLLVSVWSQAEREDSVNDAWINFYQNCWIMLRH